jgi:hypothetical protein
MGDGCGNNTRRFGVFRSIPARNSGFCLIFSGTGKEIRDIAVSAEKGDIFSGFPKNLPKKVAPARGVLYN